MPSQSLLFFPSAANEFSLLQRDRAELDVLCLSKYLWVHACKLKRVFQQTLSTSSVFQTSESSKLLFYVSEASPTSKEFCNKGEAFHPQKELLLSRLVHRAAAAGTDTEPSWKSLKWCCLLTSIKWQGLLWCFLVFRLNVQHVTSILHHSISCFSSIISTCYFKGGDDKTTTLQFCHLYQIQQQHVIHMAMYSMGRELHLSNKGKVIN